VTTIDLNEATVERPGDRFERDEAELAAASFLARYSGRTLEAYRHHLRGFFQWADNHLEVLNATRPHIELFRAWMEHRQLAASTIHRRLSTVCGFCRFAYIDGRIGSNPAQYVRLRPPNRHRRPQPSLPALKRHQWKPASTRSPIRVRWTRRRTCSR
jgi:integrase/recombinase XerD